MDGKEKTYIGALCSCALCFGALLSLGACGRPDEGNETSKLPDILLMPAEEMETILAQAGWTTGTSAERFRHWRPMAGVTIEPSFKGDLAKDGELSLPAGFQAGDAIEGSTGRWVVLAQSVATTIAGHEVDHLVPVSFGELSSDETSLVLPGVKLFDFLGKNQKRGLDTVLQQSGSYILMEYRDLQPPLLVHGQTKHLERARQWQDSVISGRGFVRNSSSPFVVLTEVADGNFFLPVAAQGYSHMTALRVAEARLPETTGMTYGAIPPLFVDDGGERQSNWVEQLSRRRQHLHGAFGLSGSSPDDSSTKSPSKSELSEPLLAGWSFLQRDLVWVQGDILEASLLGLTPDHAPPLPPAAPTDPRPDPDPPFAGDVARGPMIPDVETPPPQADLGCTGINDVGEATLTIDPQSFNDPEFRGWRGQGDVRITREAFAQLWGDSSAGLRQRLGAGRYPDELDGYCLLTTGTGRYGASLVENPVDSENVNDRRGQLERSVESVAPRQIIPGPHAQGRTSEIWQQVTIPQKARAKSIQLRVAFFSQEFPTYLGSPTTDSFFIKFDELAGYVASGTMNDLAGVVGGELAGCAGKEQCGDWRSIKFPDYGAKTSDDANPALAGGVLWDIDASGDAIPSDYGFSCPIQPSADLRAETPGSEDLGHVRKCYHGYIPPRVICKELGLEHWGQTLTLRIAIEDVADRYLDSAIAVDTIVFSKNGCDGLFTGEPGAKTNWPY